MIILQSLRGTIRLSFRLIDRFSSSFPLSPRLLSSLQLCTSIGQTNNTSDRLVTLTTNKRTLTRFNDPVLVIMSGSEDQSESEGGSQKGTNSSNGHVLRIRGLPWQSTKEEIITFFIGVNIKNGVSGIFMTLSREGRPSGEAYVELESEEDYNKGLEFNQKYLGSRYIEVFASKKQEMEWMKKKQGGAVDDDEDGEPQSDDTFLRLRGLPFSCTKDDLMEFFEGLDLEPDGVVLPTDRNYRSTGEAYLQFATREIAEKAMGKHKEKIGHRYIEIFKSSYQEFRAVSSYMNHSSRSNNSSNYGRGHYGGRDNYHHNDANSYSYHNQKMRYPARAAPYPDRFRGGPIGPYPVSGASRAPPPPAGTSRRLPPYDAPYGGGDYRGARPPPNASRYPFDRPQPTQNFRDYQSRHAVHMRGLPYKATESELFEFFLPLRPLAVNILYDEMGRASGEADVEFATHQDAEKAMVKDKAYIQKRYVELFLHSQPGNGVKA